MSAVGVHCISPRTGKINAKMFGCASDGSNSKCPICFWLSTHPAWLLLTLSTFVL